LTRYNARITVVGQGEVTRVHAPDAAASVAPLVERFDFHD
jgi:hypothetical protein